MYKIIVISLLLMVTGYMHASDPRPVYVNAEINMNENKICVKAPDSSDDEYIIYVRIFDFQEQKTTRKLDFNLNPLKLDTNNCLPVPDYEYKTGGKYTYSATTILKNKQSKGIEPHKRLIAVTFLIKDGDGEKQAVDALNM